MNYLFTYGSLILNQHNLGFEVRPIKSVFVRGYKILLEEKKESQTGYHFLKLEMTNNSNDIVAGYLVQMPQEQLERIDLYEGNSYKRVGIYCYDRYLKEYSCYVYIKNN